MNAFKFSSHGQKVLLNLTSNTDQVILEIIDQGIGMSELTRESLFNFRKIVPGLGTAGEKGSGFGMPIAKMFMDQMKIQCQIESREQKKFPFNHGTTVRLYFRKAKSPMEKRSIPADLL